MRNVLLSPSSSNILELPRHSFQAITQTVTDKNRIRSSWGLAGANHKIQNLKIRRSILPSRFFRFTWILSKMDIHLINWLINGGPKMADGSRSLFITNWSHRDFTESRIKIVRPTFFLSDSFQFSIFHFSLWEEKMVEFNLCLKKT